MKILSVSTATNNLSVAINDDEQVIVEKNITNQRNHSVNLMPKIQEALDDAKLKLTEIDRLAVTQGPGSYTGLRIGATTVKVLADVLKQELVGVSTMATLALGANVKNKLIVPILDARNDNFFAGIYRSDNKDKIKAVIPDEHIHLDELVNQIQSVRNSAEAVIFVGEFTTDHKHQFTDLLPDTEVNFGDANQNIVHASAAGELARLEQPFMVDEFVPVYLRKTQAEIDWAKKTGQKGPDKDAGYVEEV